MFKKVLIANRGAISCRIQRTLRKLNIGSVAVFSNPDRESLHALDADEGVLLPGNLASETYLDVQKIIEAARETGAEAIHPGYGFLSENAGFANACEEAGIAFIGPTPKQLETCGLKHVCRDIARDAQVPLLEGSDLLKTAEEALETAIKVGFPVILKSSAGGGGIGMQIAYSAEEVPTLFDQVRRLSQSNFGDPSLFLEKYIERARHIEVQVFGDGKGNVIALGERDCSAQRRNQKVIEETPAPGLSDEERQAIADAAIRIAKSVNYRSAGTVEFLWDDIDRRFYFLEVNARLQVEHGVTEEVWGIDLVEWMIRLAAGDLPSIDELAASASPKGHAIQTRIYAEDPNKNFQPSSGLVTEFTAPENARCDTWIKSGTEVPSFYDPMVAKVIVHESDRTKATEGLKKALSTLGCHGIETNQAYVSSILESEAFVEGTITTRFLNDFAYAPTTIDVLDPGLETTIQDYPGRIGMWDVGVPPSGPFDPLSFRLGNQILGNDEAAAGLEMAVRGPKLKFNSSTVICLTGADMNAMLDGEPIERFAPVSVNAGQVLKLKDVSGPGQRAYLLIQGGVDVPEYLGSRATFRLGKFGGHGGRALKTGDVLHLAGSVEALPSPSDVNRPDLTNQWEVRVVYGPHGAPEFFTDSDIETFFSTSWEVHYNSDRTGIRLIGPKPKWARRDGGEAGLHPSNIHDNAYCVGSIDFTGDMPILLGPDGPSLGGFVCPAVIIRADLWKMGQMKPGDSIRFVSVSNEDAESILLSQEEGIRETTVRDASVSSRRTPPILDAIDERGVIFRQSGDGVILVEFGDLVLDLDLRFRVQALHDAIQAAPFNGLLELVPGIRSLQVQFDPTQIQGKDVLKLIESAESSLPSPDEMEFPSRIVHLPLSWDDPATQEAIDKYMQIVRADAPWCPSNIEFIRRINGLESVDEVRRIVYDASYFVMGLGDVYLGAPVATPLDPRHRLVTTKYNPARTWTPENAVGIGGAYLCIYGMEGPGGYQFVGRTLPVWNRFNTTEHFEAGKPWLLRFFDQIRWFPVEADQLLEMRRQFLTGQYEIKIEETTFRPKDYHAFLKENDTSIASFRETQRQAFAEERERWEASGAMSFEAEETELPTQQDAIEIPDGCEAVTSPVAGSLWKIEAKPGDSVTEDQTLLIVESMKMEISVGAPETGKLREILVEEGASVSAGQILAILELEK
tara:strand:+ start:2317 stop:5898 length:3582 start_codon:yes stop_codon:yes gene_type:complete